MINLSREFIRDRVADSAVIYERGVGIYEHGSFVLKEAEPSKGSFTYLVDGNYGDYTIRINLCGDRVETSCDCPYPGIGCKHTVAALIDAQDIILRQKDRADAKLSLENSPEEPFFSPDEIRMQALDDREKRAKNEIFTVTEGEMLKGEHLVETKTGKQYTVTMHDPANCLGHCTCPDYLTNRLGTCKHMIFLSNYLKNKKGFEKHLLREKFPFVDIYWDSVHIKPKLFCERPKSEIKDIQGLFTEYFDEERLFSGKALSELLPLLSGLDGNKKVRVQEQVLMRIDDALTNKQMAEMAGAGVSLSNSLKTVLYPYQLKGVEFGLYKSAALIGDEMGLGKTLQAIALGILKKEIFGFDKVLVITPASLKEQWKREIEKFTDEKAVVVEGSPIKRKATYYSDNAYFKITNYEAVLRDVTILSQFKPDFVILDEAQRIKNFSTKTADAVKHIPRKHALVLTGTPLENKLEDVYSIIQFLDPYMLSPLWQFAADHFMLSRNKKGKILGYRNLNQLHEKLESIVIRRLRQKVLSDLPEETVNNYYIDLHDKQKKIHTGYLQSLQPILNKKFLTPMDLRRLQVLLLRMRMVCNSTYLIDRKTHISPKLKELQSILEELVLENGHKVVIFSEWTTMTYLIARQLSELGISFVELSGKVPVKKRQALIDEFTDNPDCKVFLSTDAGGTGLNLQAADCVINFELPWNPARMKQRIGRVNRIGQKSKSIIVVNLITKDSIEEKILTGIQLKTDLFKGVFDGGTDKVEFSREKRTEMLNKLREMMGEEPALPVIPGRPSEEIPEDTPHYLNPRVLKETEKEVDFAAEEQAGETPENDIITPIDREGESDGAESVLSSQPPEKIEQILNSGMHFLSGLMAMATGKEIKPESGDGRIVRLDKETGEVTLKFKLPGF